jgi:iron complex outermembrane receptor protein
MTETLRAIARVSGRRIEVDTESVTGRQANAVSGDLTAEQALEKALSGSGVVVRQEDHGALWVALPIKLSTVRVLAKRDQAETSFKADRSDTATRSGTSLMDLPAGVTIITGKVLETLQATSIQDALASVSGVALEQSTLGKPTLAIRGFSSTTQAVNGVSDPASTLTSVFAVERIEVLKGPQAILTGSDSMGGTVNIVTKKPQADAIRSLMVQYGSHGDATIAGDVGGSVTEDGKLSYRLIAAESKASRSDGGFDGREETAFLPQLRWKDSSTDLIVGYSYGKQFAPLPKYTFARKDGVIVKAPDMLLGQSEDGFDSRQSRAFYQLEEKFGDHLTLVSRLEHAKSYLYLHLFSPSGLNYASGATTPDGTVSFFGTRTRNDDTATSGDHYLRINGDTGPVSHKLSVGVNHVNGTYLQTGWDGAYVPDVQLFPEPSAAYAFPPVGDPSLSPSMIFSTKSNQIGAFAQDLMSWGDWNVLVNLRRTRYTTQSSSTFFYSDPPDVFVDQKYRDWHSTPGLGVIYNFTPQASVYASYAEGFSPQFTPKCGGGLTDPQLTKNKELGAKFDLLDSKLSITTAGFELTQANSLQYDQTTGCANMLPGQVTRGLEFDMQGQLAPGWNAVMNYTYSTVKDKLDPNRIFTNAPKQKVSLWTTYQLQAPDWRGLGVGVGMSAQTQTNGDFRAAYAFRKPGQAQVDVSMFYTHEKWSTTLGVKNVFDRLLYGPGSTATFLPLKEGRTFMATFKRDFN